MRIQVVLLAITLLAFTSCSKPRKIGGRVFDINTGEAIADVGLAISEMTSGGKTAFVSTNTQGYYAYKPSRGGNDFAIQVATTATIGAVGGENTLPIVKYSRYSDNNREVDFYVQQSKRLTIKFVDTTANIGEQYEVMDAIIYTNKQASFGYSRRLSPANKVDSTFEAYTFTGLGWNYISGFIRTSENIQKFRDSIFVTKPLDAVDFKIVYY